MDKVYNHKDVEKKLYRMWESRGYFTAKIDSSKKPFTIILPPPNANGSLHFGHAMFVIEDILIRYHRMLGDSTLWFPGADHAGTETQFVFEKELVKQGKSRLDFDQATLFKMIWDFVEAKRGGMETQLKRLGFSLDWTRGKFTLDKDIVRVVHQTFKIMYDEGLVYRDYRLVNYCTFDGTSFSDLEVVYEEKKAPLYFMKYGPFTIATVRPETKFRDTVLAANANDPRYKDKIGKTYQIQGLLGEISMKIIADPEVDPKFGTGIMKVTPAHDPHDFALGKKYNLPVTPIIGFDGKMDFSWFLEKKDIELKYKKRAEKYHGKYVKEARKLMVEDLKEDGLLLKTDENYTHRIGVCYKCKNVLEPLPLEQWFIKVKPLAQKAIEAVKRGEIHIVPKRFEKLYFQFLETIHDWNISRQVVWGIRIPAWKCERCAKIKNQKSKIKNDEGWIVTDGEKPQKCPRCGSTDLEQDTDTFDTWFSSSQWPFVTLQTAKPGDFEYFYPTSVMETGYDLLRMWVSRMIMMGIYVTKKVPFKTVLFHGLVNDPYGKKMSKSKGNVVNPLELADNYGADAVRFALVYGTATGNDQSLSYPKLEAMRKFTNKIWNMARFLEMKQKEVILGTNEVRTPESDPGIVRITGKFEEFSKIAKHENDKEWVKKTQELVKEITKNLEEYNFNFAAERLYEFMWHEFADKYIEDVKNRVDENSFLVLCSLFTVLLKLLHPFMPFVTEEIYQKMPNHGESLMIEQWPS